MDGLIEELLRLEGAKHKALAEIDAPSYYENARQQTILISMSESRSDVQPADLKSLLELSQLITLNERLLEDLVPAGFSAHQLG